ncbi:MAG: nuclear transport factor 2 family protein [Pseudomonadota bacterium]
MRFLAHGLTVFLLAAPAGADTPRPAGDPITAGRLADIQEMIRVADAIDAGVDGKDWDLVRSLFTDEIAVDFTSLIGGEPATIPADALVDGWATNLKPSKTSFHLRGNHRVSFTGIDSAVMLSHGYAWNRMEAGALPENGGNPLWEVWGTYEHGFERQEDGWRVTSMTFTATAERGNAFVRDTVPES